MVRDLGEQGRAVLVEKPLATTLKDCERIGDALRSNPVPFMVDFHNRWNPAMYNVKNAIKNGELGEPQMATLRLNDTIYVPTGMLSWPTSSPRRYVDGVGSPPESGRPGRSSCSDPASS